MKKNRKVFSATISSAVLLTAVVSFVSPPIASPGPHHDPLAQPTPPRLERPQKSLSACTASDKLEVTSFTITPAQPVSGQQVNIVMKIKNKCPSGTASLNVPWDIRKDGAKLAEGTVTLQPGEIKDLSAQWTAVTGTFDFSGNADPGNTSSETDRNNNTKGRNRITVGTASAIAGPRRDAAAIQIDRYLLNHVKAKDAGANFTVNALGLTPCSLETHGGSTGSTSGNEQVLVRIDCTRSLAGARADFEGYVGFTLKNGWRVDSYDIVRSSRPGYGEGGGKGWRWVSSPPSSTNPYYKLHLWAEPQCAIELFVRITIEGPAGTNPYH